MATKNKFSLKEASGAGASYAKQAAAAQKKQDEDELETIVGTGNSVKGNSLKSAVKQNQKNTFLEDTAKNIGNVFNGVNEFLGNATQNAEITKGIQDANKKITGDVVAGKLTPQKAEELKDQLKEATGVGKTLTDKVSTDLIDKGNLVKDFVVDAPKRLGEQTAAQVEYQRVLQQMRKDGEITDADYGTQEATPAVAGLQKTGVPTVQQRGTILNQEADAKVKAKVKENTGVDYNYGDQLGALVETASQIGTGGIGAKVGVKIGKGAKEAQKAIEAEQVAKNGEAFLESGKPTQKLLAEPGENFYKADRDTAAQELEKLNSMDQEYLQSNNLTTQVKSDGRLKAEELAQSPERVKAQNEAAQAVQEAKKQVDYYNQIKVASPYHRKVDELNAQKMQLVEAVKGQAIEPSGAREVAKQIDAKIASLAKQYPQEASEAPMLDQALEEASKAHLEANMNATRVIQEDQRAVMESGGMLDTPDPEKIQARQQELQTKIADIDSKVEAARARAEGKLITPDDFEARADDIQDIELSPESFTPEGELTPVARAEVDNARLEGAKAKFGIKDEALNKDVTAAVTTGKTDTNKTIDKVLASDVVRQDTKAAITELTHAVHSDDKVLSLAKSLVDSDLDVARGVFDDGALLSQNADSHMALGRELQKYYDNANLPVEAAAVLDGAARAVSNLARGTRAARFFNEMYSANYLTKHLDQMAFANGRNISEKYRADFAKRAKRVENMKAGDVKTAMQVGLKEEAELKGARAKVMEVIGQALSIPRTLLASGDFSAVGRQGFPLGSMHPVIFARVIRDQPKMLMPKFFAKKMQEIREATDRFGDSLEDAYKKAGLDVLAAFGKHEEDFNNTGILDKIPVVKQYVGLSDRSYSGPLTQLRAEVFKKWINDIGGVKAFNNLSKKEQTDMGKYINTFSGRGGFKQGGSAEKAMEAASKTLFAPRFWKANVDKINPVYYANLSPIARKQALKNLTPWLGTVAVVLSAAAAAGAEVGTDPRSSDFGKIKVGDTRFDILGGTQQNFVLAARLITGQKTNVNGDTSETSQFGAKFGENGFEGFGSEGPSSFGSSSADVLGDFVTNKTSPLVNYGLSIAEGKDIAGAPVDPLKSAVEMFIPLGAQGTAETLKGTGGDVPLTAATAGANFFGVGANTYGSSAPLSKTDNEKISEAPAGAEDAYKTFYSAAANVTGRTAREDAIKKLYKQGDVEKARRRAKEYNAFVDEKLQPYYSKYKNLDDDLRQELRNNLYITITPTKEKNWRQ